MTSAMTSALFLIGLFVLLLFSLSGFRRKRSGNPMDMILDPSKAPDEKLLRELQSRRRRKTAFRWLSIILYLAAGAGFFLGVGRIVCIGLLIAAGGFHLAANRIGTGPLSGGI